ncbi:uncharacterized protein N0V89_007051 [Didymosphaeria variabile]|uniref:Uncharacterized protein n=1 Tax=Didymosphaeria variabile TaxID=1932322 RepID=A0A9W8XKB6_9PLEO|nr:uncharacterized protein N0V89_007051 [Didymosphaeria variabile]KAJ4351708.1 hypothetical protein N0V89_007051 [Didymosphaeria variabile]
MSSRSTRAHSAEPRFMAPTFASNARARRATSAESSIPTAPSSIRMTHSKSRASSVQAHSAVTASPERVQRTVKTLSKLQALSSSVGLTVHERPSDSKSVPAKPHQDKLNDSTAPLAFEGTHKLQRTGYGDARAAREDRMGNAMSTIAQAKGLIDDETAKNWSTSWRTKGHIKLNWSEQKVAKYNAENGVMSESLMSFKEAEAIKKKKDQDLEEWCMAYNLGIIDETGNLTGSRAEMPVMKSKSRERDARREDAKKEAEKQDPLKKVKEGRVTKKIGPKKTTDLPTTTKGSSPASSPAAKPTKKADVETATKPAKAAPKKAASKSVKKPDELPIAHRPGRPSYAEYEYYELVALCRDRNIKSGGGDQAVRNHLIRDDIALDDRLPTRDAKNYTSRNESKTLAPVVPNMPIAPPAVYVRPAPKKKGTKRTRNGDDDDDDDDDDQPKKKGKKVKTT